MAVYPLTFPSIAASTERLDLTRRQAVSSSPFTLAMQTINTASQWRLTWTWPQMYLGSAEYVSAWINQLRGQIGTFTYAPRQSRTRPALTARSLHLTGYAYNNSVQIQGWSANGLSTLYVGQYFQIGEQLLQIVSAPINADVNGFCTIEFEPNLRIDYVINTTVNFTSPVGKFRLAGSDGNAFTLSPGGICEFATMQAQEAVE